MGSYKGRFTTFRITWTNSTSEKAKSDSKVINVAKGTVLKIATAKVRQERNRKAPVQLNA